MTIETLRAIARVTATAIVKERGKDVDSLTVSEWLEGELPGLDEDVHEKLIDLVDSYIRVSEVEVYVKEYLVRDDGSIKTDDDLKAEGLKTADGPW